MQKVSFTLLMFSCVIGCTKDEQKSPPATTSSPPTSASSAPVHETAPITLTTPGPVGRLPDSWPSDVPTYPGAALGASELSSRSTSVTMKTKDPPEKVAAFYVASLKGMTKDKDVGAGMVKTVSFSDEKRTVTVMAMTIDETTTQVTVTVLAK